MRGTLDGVRKQIPVPDDKRGMNDMIGKTLSHYRILEKLGEGGMGVVYAAEDTKLSRQVALKVLSSDIASSDEKRKRLHREAKVVAALSHPNIVHVYSVEEVDDTFFITMELVHGKSLKELLPAGGLELPRFFQIAVPLVSAVAAAHALGITHRDLKPDNVMMTEDGDVKILDFGLAKVRQAVSLDSGSESPTQSATHVGQIAGTFSYMSPEQAEGRTVDTRSDLFSLGIMFFEMLTGRKPFEGETAPAAISSVLKDTPPSVAELKGGIPRDLARLVKRCLVKDPTRRCQSALDLRNELDEIRTEMTLKPPGDSEAPRSTNKLWFGIALAFLAGALASRMLSFVDRSRDPRDAMRLVNPVQVTSAGGTEDGPTWSPDAGRLAYESNESGNWDIWVAHVGGGAPVNLTADNDGDDQSPSWSPDGREIAFLSNRNDSKGLYSIPSLGGSPRKLLTLDWDGFSRPSWSQDGTSVLVHLSNDAVQALHLPSGKTSRTTLPNHESNELIDISWSPDGRWFSYVEGLFSSFNPEVAKLWIVSVDGGEPIPVTDGLSKDLRPTWSPDGRTFFFVSNRGGAMDLWQQRLRDDQTSRGQARRVSTGMEIRSFAFSGDGAKLAVSRGRRISNVWRVPILTDRLATWADAEQLTADNAFIQYFDVAPDGSGLVIGSDRAGNQDLWLVSLDDGQMTQLTTHPTPEDAPRFSPDGAEIAFRSYQSGNQEIWVIPANGGPGRQLTFHPGEDSVPTWSPDGDEIAFITRRAGNRDVWVVPAKGGDPRPFTTTDSGEYFPAYSPNGDWLLFASDREAPLQQWRSPLSGGKAERIAEGPAQMGAWSPDSRHIYLTGFGVPRNLWAVSVEDGREYPITELSGRRGTLGYCIATDGEYAYFTWWEELGDIWVMDVVTNE